MLQPCHFNKDHHAQRFVLSLNVSGIYMLLVLCPCREDRTRIIHPITDIYMYLGRERPRDTQELCRYILLFSFSKTPPIMVL